MYRISSPFTGDRDIVLVDTPGLNNLNKSDRAALGDITRWFRITVPPKPAGQTGLDRILFFHNISDNRAPKYVSPDYMETFKTLCGDLNMHKVVLVTTMWDMVEPEVGQKREKELKAEYWGSMATSGSQVKRFERTLQWHSALDVLDPLGRNEEWRVSCEDGRIGL